MLGKDICTSAKMVHINLPGKGFAGLHSFVCGGRVGWDMNLLDLSYAVYLFLLYVYLLYVILFVV